MKTTTTIPKQNQGFKVRTHIKAGSGETIQIPAKRVVKFR